jgi:hypothetical protein
VVTEGEKREIEVSREGGERREIDGEVGSRPR